MAKNSQSQLKFAGSIEQSVLYARLAVRYGTPQFLQKVRYAGTVRIVCDGTGTVRWYGTLQKLN